MATGLFSLFGSSDLSHDLFGFGVAVGGGFPHQGDHSGADQTDYHRDEEHGIPSEMLGEVAEGHTGDGGAGVPEYSQDAVGGGAGVLGGLLRG